MVKGLLLTIPLHGNFWKMGYSIGFQSLKKGSGVAESTVRVFIAGSAHDFRILEMGIYA